MKALGRGSGILVPGALLGSLALGLIAGIEPKAAVGLALGVAFAILVFIDLATGFAAVALLSFLDVLPTSGSLSVPKAAGLLVAAAWFARISLRQDERTFFSAYPVLTWTMVAFLTWGAVTLLWADQVGVGVTALSRYGLNMLLLPIAYTAIRTRRDLTLVLLALVTGALVAAAFGILQPPAPELSGEAGRAGGTIGDPNELAAALIVGLALAAGYLLARGRPAALRIGGAIAIPICALGIFASLSRGGLIALLVLLVAGTILAGRWRVAMTGMLVLVVTAGVLYFTQIASTAARERVTTAQGGSGRSDLWTVAWRMVQAHPVRGVGVGNFPIASPQYVLQPGLLRRSELIFAPVPRIAHNTYLGVLAEMGIPGAILFLAIVLSCFRFMFRAAGVWARMGDVGSEALARGVLLATVGMLAADFFISEMYEKLFWIMLALGPAVLALALRERESDVSRATPEPSPEGSAPRVLALPAALNSPQ